MKKLIFILTVALFGISCNSDNNAGSTESGELTNSLDSMSYAVGSYFSKQFKDLGIKIQAPVMSLGLKEAMAGNSYMDESTIKSFIRAYQVEMRSRKGAPLTEGEQLNIALDSLAYAMGADLGGRMESVGMEFNSGTFQRGAVDFYTEGASLFDEQQTKDQIQLFSIAMQKKQQENNAILAKENEEKGKQFIAEKAKEEGVQSTASGLHYKIIKEGNGPSPTATDKVKVHYHGTLIDGTVFDSSVDRGIPYTTALDAVIKGWTEGVQLMKINSKFQFYIPADLAYADRGSPPSIGPGETLIFDVELLEIE